MVSHFCGRDAHFMRGYGKFERVVFVTVNERWCRDIRSKDYHEAPPAA